MNDRRLDMAYSHASIRLAAAAVLIAGGSLLLQPGEAGRAAAPSASAAAEQSPFIGEWELDLTRMPDTYGPPPKRVTFAFEDAGSGEWVTKVDIAAPDGSSRHIAIRYRRDGRAVQGEGDDADGDSAAFSAPAPNVLVMSMAKNKASAGVRVYTVSGDGKEMTEAAANVDAQGAPFVRTFHFRRIR
ncbi:hypothetical protein OF829_15040 [Sphingomonas sp. LB-2]|uniref:hypothetical protein n=1 Tax=Sphingomonas caeni TaxID=2984949 RepID=UPI00222F3FB4|nr:hypothetical protein [Sphingomonas caeni]MCW3848549.1 hypothetical protein [Sphingomonas caeni]